MKELNLYRLWEVMNTLSYKQAKLAEEEDKYIDLLGHSSNYINMSFESFLEHYSFKFKGDNIVVFNTDPIPYEDWDNNDVSYIPSVLLSFSAEKLEKWIETEIGLHLDKIEREKIAEKENLKRQIEQLTKRLNNL